jgi:hypothetical protein
MNEMAFAGVCPRPKAIKITSNPKSTIAENPPVMMNLVSWAGRGSALPAHRPAVRSAAEAGADVLSSTTFLPTRPVRCSAQVEGLDALETIGGECHFLPGLILNFQAACQIDVDPLLERAFRGTQADRGLCRDSLG